MTETSVNTTATKLPVSRVNYNGKIGQILGIHFVNILLNIITIGIYSFWGKTRLRRYMTAHLSLKSDAFQYTGTGGELFIGWLKALVIFLPIVILMYVPFVNIIVLPIFLALIAVAVYWAMRYRLSRTTWRGVRFALYGSVRAYLWIAIKRAFINIVTLGVCIPKSDITKWEYIANNMQYGETSFTYQGDHKRLMKVHLITWAIIIFLPISGIIFGAITQGSKMVSMAQMSQIQQQQQMQQTDPSIEYQHQYNATPQQIAPQAGEYSEYNTGATYTDPKTAQQNEQVKAQAASLVTFIILFYALAFVAGIARMCYYAALWQERFRGLRIGELRFKLDMTAPAFIKLHVINILIIIFTLGLGKPIATHRTLRFFTERLKIGGDVNSLIVMRNKNSTGNGTGDALAADVGFDLGM